MIHSTFPRTCPPSSRMGWWGSTLAKRPPLRGTEPPWFSCLVFMLLDSTLDFSPVSRSRISRFSRSYYITGHAIVYGTLNNGGRIHGEDDDGDNIRFWYFLLTLVIGHLITHWELLNIFSSKIFSEDICEKTGYLATAPSPAIGCLIPVLRILRLTTQRTGLTTPLISSRIKVW